MNLPREGEQLVLRLRMPWDGRSPRSLTKGSELLSFVRSGTGRANLGPIDGVQLDLFPKESPYGS